MTQPAGLAGQLELAEELIAMIRHLKQYDQTDVLHRVERKLHDTRLKIRGRFE